MATLNSIIRNVLAIDPSAPAIEFQKVWHSWGDISKIINSLDSVLKDNNIGTGARIGSILRNRPQIAAAIVGIITSDRCLVTLNPSQPDDLLVKDISNLQTPVIVAMREDWERLAIFEAAKSSGALCIELTGDPANPVRVLLQKSRAQFESSAQGIGIEMLTSGTTGPPKRIPLKAANFSRMVLDAAVYENRDVNAVSRLSKAVNIANAPYSHIGGIFGIFSSFSAGRKTCLLDRFRVEEFVDAIERHRPKVVNAPPSALRMILDAKVPKEALSSLTVFRTATAPLDPALADQFYEAYGIPVLQNYGATEFAGGVAGWTLSDFQKFAAERRGSVGRISPGIEARIVDAETGQPMPYGEAGLLELRAKHLSDGNGWVRTTDLARMDAEQFLWILGRADNAIIRGGFKIMPDDVVQVIESHPAVLEACVVALPDSRLGQVPAAAYRLGAGQVVSEDELRSFLRERLTAYQLPTKLVVLKEFPRTASMKPNQLELKKLLEAA
jgi:long-chain acyl-CoA synthetase